jgi:hypothetical protein
LFSAGINANHIDAHVRQLGGQRPVAAAQIKDTLTRHRRQQIDHRLSEVGDKPRRPRVLVGIPSLSDRGLGMPEARAA